LSFLDPQTLDTLYKVVGIGAILVTAAVVLTRWRYERERRHDSLNDVAQEIAAYIQCLREMKEDYTSEYMEESTSEDDNAFYKRMIGELDRNFDRNQRQLNRFMERITRRD
jgi:hypothetical protein